MLGGNIGAFAHYALSKGAKKIVSFEPDPNNITVFKKQDLAGVKLIKGAISQNKGEAKLYINAGKNKGMHSLQPIQGREYVVVKTYPFHDALQRYKPDLVKIDIEGGEFGIDLTNIPEFVKGIAIEIHLNHSDNRQKAPALLRILEKQFPNILKSPSITEKNWTTYFIGTRRDKHG